MPTCEKCGQDIRPGYLDKHDTAVHAQSLTDEQGRCKMCGDPVEEAGRHLREVCDPSA